MRLELKEKTYDFVIDHLVEHGFKREAVKEMVYTIHNQFPSSPEAMCFGMALQNCLYKFFVIYKGGDEWEIIEETYFDEEDLLVEELKKAYEYAGFREVSAMERTKPVLRDYKGRLVFEFTYSLDDPYQDANGAKFDIMARKWVN